MSRRGALVYLAIALLLGAAYFLATRQETRKAERESLARRVFDIRKDSVAALTVRRGEDPEVRIERAPGGEPGGNGEGAWRIVAPMRVAADSGAIGSLIDAALEAEKRRTLEGGDVDPSDYGLDRPALRVSLESGGASHTIEFGVESITGDARYARIAGGNGVFLTPASTFNRMDLGLEGLRDRRLLPLDRAVLEAITVQWDDARVVLRKEEGAWRFAKRPRPVSQTAVDGLIATLSETNVDRFVTDDEVAPEEYKLDRPDAMVTFEGGGKTWVARLGKAPGEDDGTVVIAARSTAPGIVALAETFLDRLPRSAADLEDQTLLRAEAGDVRAVTLRAGEAEARFVGEGDDWKRADAKTDGKPDVPALLSLLGDLRHEGAPPGGGAMSGEPELSLLLEGAGGQAVLDLRIGTPLEGNGERPGRLTDGAGEREILLTNYTVENLQDEIRALAPGLLPPPAPAEPGTS